MRREAVGNAEELLVEGAQPFGGDRRHDLVAGRSRNVRVVACRRLRPAERLLQRLVGPAELGENLLVQLVRLLLRDVALGHETRGELLARRRMLCNRGR